MVWLSYYEEYSIYEPAEGGYYYAGLRLVETERLSKRAAKRKFDELAKEYVKDENDENDWYDPFPWIQQNILYGRQLCKGSRYIGEGAMIVVERKKGSFERGWVPYSQEVNAMAKFRVWAECVSYVYLDVEADDEYQAKEIAEEADGGEFEPTPWGDWKMGTVERIDQEVGI